jgi:uncharacterized protein
MINVYYLILGLVAGAIGGFAGIGGGVIIVPVLVIFFGMNQHLAQGTTLALMVPPVSLLAAMRYYKSGYVDLLVATIICIGFLIGSWGTASIAVNINKILLQRIFGVLLLLISVKMIFFNFN